jgi:hypothetical protein
VLVLVLVVVQAVPGVSPGPFYLPRVELRIRKEK